MQEESAVSEMSLTATSFPPLNLCYSPIAMECVNEAFSMHNVHILQVVPLVEPYEESV